MKTPCLTFFLVCLVAGSAIGQVKIDKPESKIQSFAAGSGKLIEKTFESIGEIQSARVQILTLKDVLTGVQIQGVRLSLSEVTRFSTDEKVAFLDADEVSSVLKTLDHLEERQGGPAPASYTEIVYTSRSGFTLGGFYSEGKWSFFMKLERFDSKSYVWFSEGRLPIFRALLEDCQSKLKKTK